MEMVMPVNYVEMTDDEMMYVDGGGYLGINLTINKHTLNTVTKGAISALAGEYAGYYAGLALASSGIGALVAVPAKMAAKAAVAGFVYSVLSSVGIHNTIRINHAVWIPGPASIYPTITI